MPREQKQNKPLFVTVRSRDGVVFEGNALSVSSFNNTGPFDVLGEHANFITLVSKSIKIIKSEKDTQEIDLTNGVMRVYKNIIDIFLGVTK